MPASLPRILHAAWTGDDTGIITLSRDWVGRRLPPLRWGRDKRAFASLEALPPEDYAAKAGHHLDGPYLVFLLAPEQFPTADLSGGITVAGDFNGWGDAVGRRAWRLEPLHDAQGRLRYSLTVLRREVLKSGPVRFKFVTGKGTWLEIPADAPNAVVDGGFRNWEVNPGRSGRHRYAFRLAPGDLPRDGIEPVVAWTDPHHEEFLRVSPGGHLLGLSTRLPLGARLEGQETVFRLFGPRLRGASVLLAPTPEAQPETIAMRAVEPVTWEARVPGRRVGWCYWFTVDADPSEPSMLADPAFRVLDPYALAAVGPRGPGLVVDPARLPRPAPFRAPPPEELVIVEAHVRDLAAKAPVGMPEEDRLGFAGARRWIEAEGSYLRSLGVNAIEFQPIQENDAPSREAYHWGYMTTNFFAPASQYAGDPAAGSQVAEFAALVDACHRAGLAVILDVVYNHVGEPAHLMFLDRAYFFDLDEAGGLVNWSGCGNTTRPGTPMMRDLVLRSLRHLVQVYGVDGFRFDLAELLGLPLLREIEAELRAIRPDILLVAEPWSFRGNIVEGLRDTGFASWNDGFREFVADYVLGRGKVEGLRYYLAGSPGNHARRPAQSINYVESHDDRAWIDRITENADTNGYWPTAHDRRRTHLMAAILFASLGVPMLSAGQDFLRSKQGHHNTYQRGDLNALDYGRAAWYPATADYFRRWIALRRGELGRSLRVAETPPAGYLRFLPSRERSAGAMVFNADGSGPGQSLLFAVNPHFEESRFPLGGIDLAAWRLVADHERVDESGLVTARPGIERGELVLPPLGCCLFAAPRRRGVPA